jgi:hypothetical protein
MGTVDRVAAWDVPGIWRRAFRRRSSELSRAENPETVLAAANQGICGDFAWTLLALEQSREPKT